MNIFIVLEDFSHRLWMESWREALTNRARKTGGKGHSGEILGFQKVAITLSQTEALGTGHEWDRLKERFKR